MTTLQGDNFYTMLKFDENELFSENGGAGRKPEKTDPAVKHKGGMEGLVCDGKISDRLGLCLVK